MYLNCPLCADVLQPEISKRNRQLKREIELKLYLTRPKNSHNNRKVK